MAEISILKSATGLPLPGVTNADFDYFFLSQVSNT